MGHSFVPQDPFQRVLRLSEDLLKSGLSFSIALKIEGSVDFSFSSGQKAVRLGAENTTTRGPSYTRRQIKRIMQRMEPQMPPGPGPQLARKGWLPRKASSGKPETNRLLFQPTDYESEDLARNLGRDHGRAQGQGGAHDKDLWISGRGNFATVASEGVPTACCWNVWDVPKLRKPFNDINSHMRQWKWLIFPHS